MLLATPDVSLAGTTVICCTGMSPFPSNVPPRATPAASPARRRLLPSGLRPCSRRAAASTGCFQRNKTSLPDCSSLSAPIRIINGNGDGAGHRGNRRTAPETEGCEVVIATGKLLRLYHFLLLPPARRPMREKELRWAKQ